MAGVVPELLSQLLLELDRLEPDRGKMRAWLLELAAEWNVESLEAGDCEACEEGLGHG